VPALHRAFSEFDESTWIRCCGGLCQCRCNLLPSSWTAEFYDIFSTDGTHDCLEGLTIVIERGLNSNHDPITCGGTNFDDVCGDIQWISANITNPGFGIPTPPTSMSLGMRVTHAHAPGGSFFLSGAYQIGDGIFNGDWLLASSVTSNLVTLSDFAHFSQHQFSATLTPNL